MPLKPAKRLIKFWMLGTSYLRNVFNFDMYCGKKGKVEKSGCGLGYDAVIHL